MKKIKPRYNGVTVHLHGAVFIYTHLFCMWRKVASTHHEVVHAAYSVPEGQDKIHNLWIVAATHADDTSVRMIASKYDGGNTA